MKKRIFVSNTLMVIVTLAIFLMLNLFIIKLYWHSAETELRETAGQIIEAEDPGEMLEEWMIHQDKFLILFGIDGVLCIFILVAISQIFTGRLTRHIMEPLELLSDGAERIRNNELTQDIQYSGDAEFEEVCDTFNSMRESLRQEQEKNHKYEKARTDMIAGISHDLRTPLTAIKGTVKGLLDGVAETPEQQQIFLKTAYRRTGEMEILLEQLFFFSKMETGNLPVTLEAVEIGAFLADYVQTAGSGQERIALNTNGVSAEIMADTGCLRRILDNLLENSRKYAARELLEIDIALHRKEDRIDICFRDNGVGVPEEKLPHIFEEFYRADEARSGREGNGLGLYIVDYLMRAMGGTVRAENAGGLAIHLELPEQYRGGETEDDRG